MSTQKSTIYLPIWLNEENFQAFAFVMDLAHKSNSKIELLFENPKAYDAENYNSVYSNTLNAKNEIMLYMLSLKGMYLERANSLNILKQVKVKYSIATCLSDLIALKKTSSYMHDLFLLSISSMESEKNKFEKGYMTHFIQNGKYSIIELPGGLVYLLVSNHNNTSQTIFEHPLDQLGYSNQWLFKNPSRTQSRLWN